MKYPTYKSLINAADEAIAALESLKKTNESERTK